MALQILRQLYSAWDIEPILADFLNHWAIFHFSKWPNIEEYSRHLVTLVSHRTTNISHFAPKNFKPRFWPLRFYCNQRNGKTNKMVLSQFRDSSREMKISAAPLLTPLATLYFGIVLQISQSLGVMFTLFMELFSKRR